MNGEWTQTATVTFPGWPSDRNFTCGDGIYQADGKLVFQGYATETSTVVVDPLFSRTWYTGVQASLTGSVAGVITVFAYRVGRKVEEPVGGKPSCDPAGRTLMLIRDDTDGNVYYLEPTDRYPQGYPTRGAVLSLKWSDGADPFGWSNLNAIDQAPMTNNLGDPMFGLGQWVLRGAARPDWTEVTGHPGLIVGITRSKEMEVPGIGLGMQRGSPALFWSTDCGASWEIARFGRSELSVHMYGAVMDFGRSGEPSTIGVLWSQADPSGNRASLMFARIRR